MDIHAFATTGCKLLAATFLMAVVIIGVVGAVTGLMATMSAFSIRIMNWGGELVQGHWLNVLLFAFTILAIIIGLYALARDSHLFPGLN